MYNCFRELFDDEAGVPQEKINYTFSCCLSDLLQMLTKV